MFCKYIEKDSVVLLQPRVYAQRISRVTDIKSCILAIYWHLIIILKNTFFNSEFLKVPSSHCYQSILVIVIFIDQMFRLGQSEISFHIIMVETNFGVRTRESIRFAENIASLLISKWFSTSPLQFISQRIYTFYKTHQTEPNIGNPLNKLKKSSLCDTCNN